MSHLLVLTNCPDAACAESIANAAVDAGLAACVNILAPCRSIYRWQGAIEAANEIPLLMKTTQSSYPALEAKIRSMHPYQVAEIVALPIVAGLPDYLQWVSAETGQA